MNISIFHRLLAVALLVSTSSFSAEVKLDWDKTIPGFTTNRNVMAILDDGVLLTGLKTDFGENLLINPKTGEITARQLTNQPWKDVSGTGKWLFSKDGEYLDLSDTHYRYFRKMKDDNDVFTDADLKSAGYLNSDILISAGKWLTFIEKKTGRIVEQKSSGDCRVENVVATTKRIFTAGEKQICEFDLAGNFNRSIATPSLYSPPDNTAMEALEFKDGNAVIYFRSKEQARIDKIDFFDSKGNETFLRRATEPSKRLYTMDIAQIDDDSALVLGSNFLAVVDSTGLVQRELTIKKDFINAVKLSGNNAVVVSTDSLWTGSGMFKVTLEHLDTKTMKLSPIKGGEHTFEQTPDPYKVGHPVRRNASYIVRGISDTQVVGAFGDAIVHSFTGYITIDRKTVVKSFTLTP